MLQSHKVVRAWLDQEALTKARSIISKGYRLGSFNSSRLRFAHIANPLASQELAITLGLRELCSQFWTDDISLAQLTVDRKPPKTRGHKPHCDNEFLGDVGLNSLAVFFAIDDCTPENGGLAFYKGHDVPDDISERIFGNGIEFPDTFFLNETLSMGDVVIWFGKTIHLSRDNNSELDRLSVLFHLISGESEGLLPDYTPLMKIY